MLTSLVLKSAMYIIGAQWYQLEKRKQAYGRKRGIYITDNYKT